LPSVIGGPGSDFIAAAQHQTNRQNTAGAARELEGAVIVNPFDIEGMAEAILQGLNMPVGERRERRAAMMKVLSVTT
jgi:trehalose-6-phosphate synthase